MSTRRHLFQQAGLQKMLELYILSFKDDFGSPKRANMTACATLLWIFLLNIFAPSKR
jgi:hypothetical protein